MKKLITIMFLVVLVVIFQSVAFADSDQQVTNLVGEDIESRDDEVKIVSVEAPVVGEDIIIRDDEVKIVSVEAPVVGEDIEIRDDEVKIVSIDEEAPVVGEDIEIREDEAKIVTVGEDSDEESDDKKGNALPIYAGIIVLGIAGGGFAFKKFILK